MVFLIDAYNLLYHMGLMRRNMGPEGLLRVREALVERIKRCQSYQEHEFTLVFDAANAPADARDEERRGPIRILFAVGKGNQADEVIEALLAHDHAPRRLTVVSNDRRLLRAAQRRRTACWKCAQFLEWLDQPPVESKPVVIDPARAAGDKPLPEIVGNKESWLREFQHLDNDPTLGEPPLSFDED
jgi:predicted RNA-binding protein with PIN domain